MPAPTSSPKPEPYLGEVTDGLRASGTNKCNLTICFVLWEATLRLLNAWALSLLYWVIPIFLRRDSLGAKKECEDVKKHKIEKKKSQTVGIRTEMTAYLKEQPRGCLVGSVVGACDSWTWNCGFESHFECKDYLKKNPLKENQPREEKDVGKLVMANMNPDSACKIITSCYFFNSDLI